MVRPLRLSQPLRPRRLPQTPRPRARFASSGPEGSSEAAKKAQDAVSTAQKYAGEAVEKGKQMLGPIGERLAGLLGGTLTFGSCIALMLYAASYDWTMRRLLGACVYAWC